MEQEKRLSSKDLERALADGFAPDSMWTEEVDLADIKKEMDEESDFNSDAHEAEEMCESDEMSGTPAEQHGQRSGRQQHKHERQFRCEACDMTIETQIGWQIHTALHERDNCAFRPYYVCAECDSTFPHLQQLRKHRATNCTSCKQSEEQDGNESRLPCEVCGKSFKTARNLREHIAVKHAWFDRYHDQACYVCEQCDMEFENRIQLKVHRRSHVGSGLFRCRLCDKSYTKKRALKMHMDLKHAPEKPLSDHFNCDVCGQAFPNSLQLRLHKRKHIRKQCPVCMKVYGDVVFYHHLKSHNLQEYNIVCKFCNRMFLSKNYLRVHIRRCHRETDEETDEN